MSDYERVFVPSFEYEAGPGRGVLSLFEPGTRTLLAGFQIDPRFMPIPVDIVLDKDVPVTLRDGVTIYTDVFRPAAAEPVPVIVAWSPYGKSGGTAPSTAGIFAIVGLDNSVVSGLEKFEGPDPAYWCAHGYAVCNPDARGIAESGGDSVLWDRQEGEDCHDLIEWLAEQDWCSGKVGMSGTSYLAAAQWFAAAEQPPHLTAINPWEGVSDVYRDLVLRGGMPDLGFTGRIAHNFAGKGQREDVVAEAERYPLMNGLWENKTPRFDRITVPAYVVASYSNTLHAAGTFRAWRRIASEQKWLRVHNTQEWPDYYDEHNVEDLRRFFDRYLKNEDNDWEQTPRVRYSVIDMKGGDRINVGAGEFPPDGTVSRKFFLHGASRTLSPEPPAAEVTAAYSPGSLPGQVSFIVRFEEQTDVVGYPKLHLWIEAEGADDLDLFILLQKLNPQGAPLQVFTVPNQAAMIQDMTERTGSVLRYKGCSGRHRVSMRHLDESLSTDDIPAHTFDRVEKLEPGEVVDVEIDLFPVGLAFHPGEQLRLVVSGRNLLGGIMPGVPFYDPTSESHHIVHTGGSRASYLQLPILKLKA